MKGQWTPKIRICGRSFLMGLAAVGIGSVALLIPLVGWFIGIGLIAFGLYLMIQSLFICPFV